MNVNKLLTLYVLKYAGREVTYDYLVKKTELTRYVLRKVLNGESSDSLARQGFVKVSQYSHSDPYMFEITKKGLKYIDKGPLEEG